MLLHNFYLITVHSHELQSTFKTFFLNSEDDVQPFPYLPLYCLSTASLLTPCPTSHALHPSRSQSSPSASHTAPPSRGLGSGQRVACQTLPRHLLSYHPKYSVALDCVPAALARLGVLSGEPREVSRPFAYSCVARCPGSVMAVLRVSMCVRNAR